MIKCLVFDLDNTLIKWKDEYVYTFYNTLDKLGLKYDDEVVQKLNELVDVYEDKYSIYTKENFLNFLNKECNINLPIEFVDILMDEQCDCYDKYTDEEIDTIKYLSSKYDLICVTNWFTRPQIERLKGAGIYKYFKLVSGGDEHELKPSLNAFNMIENKSECIMIGDSLKKDIYPALELGMKVVLITNEDIKDSRFKTIKNITELKEML